MRITGKLGNAMVEAALDSLLGAWSGDATDIGVTQPRSYWRRDMRFALEAAFEVLLKEPT